MASDHADADPAKAFAERRGITFRERLAELVRNIPEKVRGIFDGFRPKASGLEQSPPPGIGPQATSAAGRTLCASIRGHRPGSGSWPARTPAPEPCPRARRPIAGSNPVPRLDRPGERLCPTFGAGQRSRRGTQPVGRSRHARAVGAGGAIPQSGPSGSSATGSSLARRANNCGPRATKLARANWPSAWPSSPKASSGIRNSKRTCARHGQGTWHRPPGRAQFGVNSPRHCRSNAPATLSCSREK